VDVIHFPICIARAAPTRHRLSAGVWGLRRRWRGNIGSGSAGSWGWARCVGTCLTGDGDIVAIAIAAHDAIAITVTAGGTSLRCS
jgi:hypothetical protein